MAHAIKFIANENQFFYEAKVSTLTKKYIKKNPEKQQLLQQRMNCFRNSELHIGTPNTSRY